MRTHISRSVLAISLVVTLSLCAVAADPLPSLANSDKNAPPVGTQAVQSLEIRVVSQDGQPIEHVQIVPVMLDSLEGISDWSANDSRAMISPKEIRTDGDGRASVTYPYYRDVKQGVRTSKVTLKINHSDFASRDTVDINVPLKDASPHQIRMVKGTVVELRPSIDGQPTDLSEVYALWSEPRGYYLDWKLNRTASGTLRLSPMKAGPQTAIVGKYDGDRLTHLSSIVRFKIDPQNNPIIDVPLKPLRAIKGRLSDNVPRPVRNGRVQVLTIPLPDRSVYDIYWTTYVDVQADGTFTIADWLPDEAIQVVALCDGFIATSGGPPSTLTGSYDPAKDRLLRPQCFAAADADQIVIAMQPLAQCNVTTIDVDHKPVADINVMSLASAGWWYLGAMPYCSGDALVHGEDFLRTRMRPNNGHLRNPFAAVCDGKGQAILHLPTGRRPIFIDDTQSEYEVPINDKGGRYIDVELASGDVATIELQLQHKGTELLGDWDKVTGILRDGQQTRLPASAAK